MNRRFIFCAIFLSFIVYSIIVYTSGNEANRLSENGIKGKLLFQNHNCISCHQIYGLGGYLGADLTTVVSSQDKGIEYARTFIKYGTRQMPDFKMSDEEVDFIIEYLKSVDQTAIAYKKKININEEDGWKKKVVGRAI